MAASKAGKLATLFSLNSDDVVFMFPRRATFGKEELAAAGSKAMAGVQIDRTSGIVDLQALADWGLGAQPPADHDHATRRQADGPVRIDTDNPAEATRRSWVIARDANLLAPESATWEAVENPLKRRGQFTTVPSEVVRWAFVRFVARAYSELSAGPGDDLAQTTDLHLALLRRRREEGVGRSTRRPRRRCTFEVLETRQLLALTVLNANDSGPGSLRQAILDANSQATSQATIVFTLPAGPQTIDLLSPLPSSTHAILAQLDATQDVTVVSPATGAQDNLPALTETGGGTLTFDGTNNPTGNIQVDSGSLQLNAGDPPATAPQPFGPVQGVDGDPLAELWPYGGVVANGNAFARGPVLFTTQAGTVLAFAGYQSSAQDNTGSNDMFVRRSNDNGRTFGAASIISPPQLPGDAALLASWGGTSWIVGSSRSPPAPRRHDLHVLRPDPQRRPTGGRSAGICLSLHDVEGRRPDVVNADGHHGGNGLRWESECGHHHVGHGSDAGSRAPWIDL